MAEKDLGKVFLTVDGIELQMLTYYRPHFSPGTLLSRTGISSELRSCYDIENLHNRGVTAFCLPSPSEYSTVPVLSHSIPPCPWRSNSRSHRMKRGRLFEFSLTLSMDEGSNYAV